MYDMLILITNRIFQLPVFVLGMRGLLRGKPNAAEKTG
jgi:hypothetical protein